jgi:lactate dehydrogenase-like 2-hydroxyacid dehydrogenase
MTATAEETTETTERTGGRIARVIGPVVDEEALAQALEDGTIFAAGLDVYEREPTVSPRLLAAPRAVLTPHLGSASRTTRTRMAHLACDGIVAVLAGQRPTNLVAP